MKVLFIDSVHPILEDRLQDAGFECIDGTRKSFKELQPYLQEAEGAVIRSKFKMTAEVMDQMPNLKFIARSGSGMENIDIEHAKKKGIRLYNSPEGNCDAVGEHAVGMLLSLLHKICKGNIEVREGQWLREENRGRELSEMTVGIIGYGHTGQAFAKRLSGFGCRIMAHDKYKTGFGNAHVEEADIDSIKRDCDVLSFHLPLTDETRYYFDAEFGAEMEKPFILINTSRGKVVDTAALVELMRKEKVIGAGLDVLEYEKVSFESLDPGNIPEPLLYLSASEKAILTPHVAGWTVESYIKLSTFLADKILRDFNA